MRMCLLRVLEARVLGVWLRLQAQPGQEVLVELLRLEPKLEFPLWGPRRVQAELEPRVRVAGQVQV